MNIINLYDSFKDKYNAHDWDIIENAIYFKCFNIGKLLNLIYECEAMRINIKSVHYFDSELIMTFEL